MKTGTAVGSALTADGIKNTVIGLGGLSFGTMISSAGGVAVGAPVAVASGALAVAGAVESAYGATVLLSSARNMGSDMQKLGDAMSSPEDAGEVPDYVKNNRVPLDKETVLLSNKNYIKTNYNVKGAQVYKNGDYYYYRDTFHTGEASHLEVFNKQGVHVGEANPLTGKLIPNTVDPSKKINLK